MQEIHKGVYRCNGELNTCNNEPLIVVHPWYNEKTNTFEIHDEKNISYSLRIRGYLKNLKRLLENSSKRNVVLFEGNPLTNLEKDLEKFSELELLKTLENSWKRIINLRGDRGLYGLVTYKDGPKPLFKSWKSTFRLIKSLSSTVELSGGSLGKTCYKNCYDGCAGLVYEKLLKNNFKVKLAKGCCFAF